MKRTPWSFLLVAAAVASLVPSACSNTVTQPPELPDCTSTPDASCNAATSGAVGGGVTIPGGDSSTELDSPVAENLDGGACSYAADLIIASNTTPAYPACAPCITAAPGSGTANCCGADMACSKDTGCLTIILQCVLHCIGTPGCVQGCEAPATPSSVATYIDFGNCLTLNCPTQCPSLPPGTAATGDL